jgi:hypothetical protein
MISSFAQQVSKPLWRGCLTLKPGLRHTLASRLLFERRPAGR